MLVQDPEMGIHQGERIMVAMKVPPNGRPPTRSLKNHTRNGEYRCHKKKCQCLCASAEDLIIHMRFCTGEAPVVLPPVSAPHRREKRTYPCRKCMQVFQSIAGFNSHKRHCRGLWNEKETSGPTPDEASQNHTDCAGGPPHGPQGIWQGTGRR